MNIPTPLDLVKPEARRIGGLLELELGANRPWFIAFPSVQRPGVTILYHNQGGISVGYTDDNMAVGSFLTELCDRLKISPAK
jgi:hypothetical protein